MQKKKFKAKIDDLFPVLVLLFCVINVSQQFQQLNIPSVILSLVGVTGVILFFKGIKYFSICLNLWIWLQLISITQETYDPTYQVWYAENTIFDLTQGFKFGIGFNSINGTLKTGIYVNVIAIAFFAFLKILQVSAMVGRQLHFRPFRR